MLSGKVTLVTGGTSGIGAAIVRLFTARGAKVLFGGRNCEQAQRLMTELQAGPGRAVFVAGEITQSCTPDALVAAAIDEFGRLDVLVNNAGILRFGDVLACSDPDWEDIFAVNVTALMRCSRAAIRQMLRQGQGGSIINMASDWGLRGARGAVAYAASKGAVVQLTRSMALDHAHQGIRVNAVCPGDTNTPMIKASPEDRVRHLEELGRAIPLGRVAQPEDVANIAAFLASNDAAHVTGALIPVDGGVTAG
jgi:NAD(P)-dependent dehydrogenase (short-subunit alcohol dehydrogenase family)